MRRPSILTAASIVTVYSNGFTKTQTPESSFHASVARQLTLKEAMTAYLVDDSFWDVFRFLLKALFMHALFSQRLLKSVSFNGSRLAKTPPRSR